MGNRAWSASHLHRDGNEIGEDVHITFNGIDSFAFYVAHVFHVVPIRNVVIPLRGQIKDI